MIMKVTVKKVTDIGRAIKITRISQGLDQFTAAELSFAGQTFLSHLENGKETAHIGKVLQVLETLGIRIELTLPPDVDDLVDSEKTSAELGKRHSHFYMAPELENVLKENPKMRAKRIRRN